jgi:hypothetical protein
MNAFIILAIIDGRKIKVLSRSPYPTPATPQLSTFVSPTINHGNLTTPKPPYTRHRGSIQIRNPRTGRTQESSRRQASWSVSVKSDRTADFESTSVDEYAPKARSYTD